MWREILGILDSEKVSKFGNFGANLVESRGEKVHFCLYYTRAIGPSSVKFSSSQTLHSTNIVTRVGNLPIALMPTT